MTPFDFKQKITALCQFDLPQKLVYLFSIRIFLNNEKKVLYTNLRRKKDFTSRRLKIIRFNRMESERIEKSEY